MNCAVCKFPIGDKPLILKPHTEPMAVVVLHPKCIGGLPLIALKWHVQDERLPGPEEFTLSDILTLGLQELADYEGGEEDASSHT